MVGKVNGCYEPISPGEIVFALGKGCFIYCSFICHPDSSFYALVNCCIVTDLSDTIDKEQCRTEKQVPPLCNCTMQKPLTIRSDTL